MTLVKKRDEMYQQEKNLVSKTGRKKLVLRFLMNERSGRKKTLLTIYSAKVYFLRSRAIRKNRIVVAIKVAEFKRMLSKYTFISFLKRSLSIIVELSWRKIVFNIK